MGAVTRIPVDFPLTSLRQFHDPNGALMTRALRPLLFWPDAVEFSQAATLRKSLPRYRVPSRYTVEQVVHTGPILRSRFFA